MNEQKQLLKELDTIFHDLAFDEYLNHESLSKIQKGRSIVLQLYNLDNYVNCKEMLNETLIQKVAEWDYVKELIEDDALDLNTKDLEKNLIEYKAQITLLRFLINEI